MTNTARENILAKLNAAQPSKTYEASDFNVLKEKQLSPEERIRKYKEVTTAVNTVVFDLDRANWVEQLEKLLEEKGIRHLMYAPSCDLGQNIEEKWSQKSAALVPYNKAMEECKDVLFDIDAAITSTLGAVAETGSVILWPTKEEPRLLSLTPPVHIAVVQADKFYNTFYEAIESSNWASNMPTNALLISGPSKTADIEQELCYGVHGPKELIVLIIHD
ncbi:conserved hypothetical protein [Candidatus Terasakiella magnetica]|uniref:LUD domain-containing protein n=1 Tax=Candidatus Terasakiella magnetica TaxID=1867952 RepID=A0A1C3RHZ8_9PROT|nr:lactate utilization protein [Candidatus Terasakiella magnetica]SCA56844.1 conserved hypothetical protein [Candidatus Terasakiella magnetica]